MRPTALEMWQPKPTLLVLLLLAVSLRAELSAGGKPLVTPVTKDPSTSLYTAPLNNGRPLVLNLSSSTITSPCSSRGGQIKKTRVLNLNLSANATDGRNPLYPVSFPAAAACAPPGAAGVAGLGRSDRSFPAQVAGTQRVANTFALCLPRDGAGVAVFGGGPLYLLPKGSSYRPAATSFLSGEVPLKWTTVFGSGPQGRYEASVTEENGIAVGGALVDFAGPGHGRFPIDVALSTTVPYTELRGDVYRDVADAFDRAMGRGARVDPPPPFELCYDSRKLARSPELGYAVPPVDLMLEGGQNWTDVGLSSMKQVDDNTACFTFVEMRQTAGMPAVVIGGFQMEDRLVVFDEEKRTLRFSGPLPARRLSCGDFNFTRAAAGGGGGDPWSMVQSI